MGGARNPFDPRHETPWVMPSDDFVRTMIDIRIRQAGTLDELERICAINQLLTDNNLARE